MILKKSRQLSLLLFFIGLGLLVILIQKMGFEKITAIFDKLDFKILIILALPLACYFLHALACFLIIKDQNNGISFKHVFLSKIVGEAINMMTPLGFFGGDPYLIYLLQKQTSKTTSTASVIIDRTMQALAIFILLLIVISIALFQFPLSLNLKASLLVLLFGFFLGLVLLINFQKKGLISTLSRFVQKLGIQKQRLQGIAHKIEITDEEIRHFYRKHKKHFFEILTIHFIARLYGPLEIYTIAQLIGYPISLLFCFYLTALTILINIIFTFVPSSLGVMEGGYGLLFQLLKMDFSYGITIQLIRRLRSIFFIILGLALILVYRPKKFSLNPDLSSQVKLN